MRHIRGVLLAIAAIAATGTLLTLTLGTASASQGQWPHSPRLASGIERTHVAAGCIGVIRSASSPFAPQWTTRWYSNPDSCYQRAALACRNPINHHIVWEHSTWHNGDHVGGVSCSQLEGAVYGGVDTGRQPGSPYVYQQLHTFTKTVHLTAYASQRRVCAGNNIGSGINGSHYIWQVWWNNNMDDCYLRSALHCYNRFGSSVWVHGGWIQAQKPTISGVNCPSGGGANGFTRASAAGADYKQNAGSGYVFIKLHQF